jgi:hypothetical protein
MLCRTSDPTPTAGAGGRCFSRLVPLLHRVSTAEEDLVPHRIDTEFKNFGQLGEVSRERICVPAIQTPDDHSVLENFPPSLSR